MCAKSRTKLSGSLSKGRGAQLRCYGYLDPVWRMGCFSALAYWGEGEHHLMLVRACCKVSYRCYPGETGGAEKQEWTPGDVLLKSVCSVQYTVHGVWYTLILLRLLNKKKNTRKCSLYMVIYLNSPPQPSSNTYHISLPQTQKGPPSNVKHPSTPPVSSFRVHATHGKQGYPCLSYVSHSAPPSNLGPQNNARDHLFISTSLSLTFFFLVFKLRRCSRIEGWHDSVGKHRQSDMDLFF